MTARLRLIPLFLLLGLLVAAFLVPDRSPPPPRHPHLAAAPDGGFAAGFQASPGDGGEFELFQIDTEGRVSGLGRYRGRLAGIATMGDALLAVTRDGTLLSFGADTETLVIGDARWNILALAWHGGRARAVSLNNGVLTLLEPAERQTWREVGEIAVDPQADEAALASLHGNLHCIWSGQAPDLSRGALRHRVWNGATWRDGLDLPFGNVDSLDAFTVADSILVAALVPNPLDGNAWPELAAGFVREDTWRYQPDLFNQRQRELFGQARQIAGAVTGKAICWLSTGQRGAQLSFQTSGEKPVELTLAPGIEPGLSWSQLSTALLFLFLIVLTVLHCRRSRQLSRRLPGMPADLSARGSALIVDWLLVSFGLVFYHVASGDLNIFMDLLTLESMNHMFWLNLGALAAYAAITEGLLFGATPGKKLAGLRVRNVGGGPAGTMQIMLRNLVRIVDMFPVLFPGLIGAVAAMFNPMRQRLGDLIGSTVVRRHARVDGRKFILASASPRRSDLFQARGLDFRAVPADIDEDSVQGDNPEETARMLAEAKARAVLPEIGMEREVVVAADTVVILDNEVLGKPKDADEAVGMLERLSGRSHTVVTGVAIFDPATGQALSDTEATEVEFRPLTRQEIDAYVATGDPLDKAGAYGVQSGNVVKQVRGSLSNVMGLPMEKLEYLFNLLDS